MPSNHKSKFRRPTMPKLRNILKTFLPLFFGYLGEVTIGATDIVMIGYLGTDELGAVGLALSVYHILETIGWGMLFPVMILISHARGAARMRIVPTFIKQGLWMSGILFIPGGIVLWNLEAILLATGQIPDLARMADHYMTYRMWAILPEFTYLVFVYALSAMDKNKIIAIVMWFGVVFNIILNYVLIFGKFGFPAMGMAGAGLASVIVFTSIHMALFGILGFYGSLRSSVVFVRAWRPKWGVLGRLFRLGWPKSFEWTIKNSQFSVAALLTGWFGAQAIASHAIARQISYMVAVVISFGLANAITIHIGVASGQNKPGDIWHIFNSGLLLLFLFMLPLAVLLGLFSSWVVALFVGSGQEAEILLPVAIPLIMFLALFILIDGLRTLGNDALNGLADMKVPALIATMAYWGVGLPAAALFGVVMERGVLGLWWGITLGVAVAATTYLLRFRWMVLRQREAPNGYKLRGTIKVSLSKTQT
uniref:Multidrug-efflux transporter n=1 Tax=Candidatus Kentrum sp. MB TaxID=2138164 RepID=A0A451BFV4_9GAMM|nr:MAG: multidrug resistance protein, MATE family [Candidatus Kentron sp. MB]VFK77174.1 MAG: multidrug resistance protein, MATE family [Candidatus Kentron sp. MB]